LSKNIKSVAESQVEMTYLALPSDANTIGTVFGGRILHLMDTAAAIAARRHSNHRVVTVAVDQVRFVKPIYVGHVITLLVSLNRAFKTSMEIGIKVMAEDTYQGSRFHAASAYFTLVGMDQNGALCSVPEIKPVKEDEIRRWREAEKRRKVKRSAQNQINCHSQD